MITQTLGYRLRKVELNNGVFAGTLQVGEDYPLPLTAPMTENSTLHIYKDAENPKVKIGYYLNPHNQQCFIRVLEAPKNQAHIKLYYDFSADPHYQSSAGLKIENQNLTQKKLLRN